MEELGRWLEELGRGWLEELGSGSWELGRGSEELGRGSEELGRRNGGTREGLEELGRGNELWRRLEELWRGWVGVPSQEVGCHIVIL